MKNEKSLLYRSTLAKFHTLPKLIVIDCRDNQSLLEYVM